MFYKGKSKVNIPLIDNHIHGSFGINFNSATYEEIKEVWSNQGTKETYKDTGVLKSVLDQHFKSR